MTTPTPRPRGHWHFGPGVFVARPRLIFAAAAGIVVSLGCAIFAPQLRTSFGLIAGWDTFCAMFLGLAFHSVSQKAPGDIRARSAEQDQGQAVILLLILTACIASVAAVAIELSLAYAELGFDKSMHVAVGVVTLAASWLLMQVIYALHYAHESYAVDHATGKDAGGLDFPGGEAPDYWDFLHFSVVIGVASQTADVAFTSRPMRRLGTVHSLIAFVFNTLILALAINLVAGLF